MVILKGGKREKIGHMETHDGAAGIGIPSRIGQRCTYYMVESYQCCFIASSSLNRVGSAAISNFVPFFRTNVKYYQWG